MKPVRVVGIGLGAMLVACNSPMTTPEGPHEVMRQGAASANADRVRLTGSGHHVRIVGTKEELTTFAFSAVSHADGSTSGQYQYNFQANGFAIHGPVTCVTRAGNQVWVGGIVDRVVTDNPAFEGLAGLEMWWRSVDNGEGAAAGHDHWCRIWVRGFHDHRRELVRRSTGIAAVARGGERQHPGALTWKALVDEWLTVNGEW